MKTKQTPTQIASEIIQGRRYLLLSECSKDINCHEYWNLKAVQDEILAYRTAWENELEIMNNIHKFLLASYQTTYQVVNERISELTSALKILEMK